MDEFFTKTKSDRCGTIFKVDILLQHRYHTILKGKAHHTDYPKLAAIEYSMASGSSPASDGGGRIGKEGTRMASRCIFLNRFKKNDMDLKSGEKVVN